MAACRVSAPQEVKLQLIPQPRQITFDAGSFKLNGRTVLETNVETGACEELLNSVISGVAGYELLSDGNGEGGIRLMVDAAFRPGVPEAYRLRIAPECISLEANASAGLFYGFQTLGQLLADRQFYRDGKKEWVLPAMTIEDEPAFSYRGLHLDVSSHFFHKEFVM